MKERVLQRMLKDFPWLWGIQQKWYFQSIEIVVRRMSNDWLLFNRNFLTGQSFRVWAVISSPPPLDGQLIQPLGGGGLGHDGKDMARSLLHYTPSCVETVEYIVVTVPADIPKHFTIYRLPRGQTFKQFCESYLNEFTPVPSLG